jgi:hypothetical protein
MARYRSHYGNIDQHFAADNYFHFPNREAVNLRENAVLIRTTILFDKDPIFEKSDVSVMRYGTVLYQLARKFWPMNSGDEPDIDELPRAASITQPGLRGQWLAGRLTFDHFPGPMTYRVRASLPSTYLGANPFICAPEMNTPPLTDPKKLRTTDLCRYGKPTWPIWVPSDAKFLPRKGELDCFAHECKDRLKKNCFINSQCVEDYHRALTERYPEKSAKTALIYLGWALHMIQDAAMPLHAANWIDRAHENIERLSDNMIRLGFGDRGGYADWTFLSEQVERIFGSREREKICRELKLGKATNLIDPSVKSVFSSVVKDAFRDRDNIRGHGDQRKRFVQEAFERAIIASMELIACLELPH